MSQENVEKVRRGHGHWIATGEFTPPRDGRGWFRTSDLSRV